MKAAAALERRYRRNLDFVCRRIGTEVLLLPIRKNMGDLESIFALNEVAARIWELLETPRRALDVRDRLVAEFDVERDEAERDLLAFLAALEAIDGVVVDEAGAR